MIQHSVDGDPRVECNAFEGLLVRYADRKHAQTIVRGRLSAGV